MDEAILEEAGTALVSSDLLKPLALTMAEAAGAAAISVQVKGHPDVKMETGEPLPVSLPVPFFANGKREE